MAELVEEAREEHEHRHQQEQVGVERKRASGMSEWPALRAEKPDVDGEEAAQHEEDDWRPEEGLENRRDASVHLRWDDPGPVAESKEGL
jgi:hypothetical protein